MQVESNPARPQAAKAVRHGIGQRRRVLGGQLQQAMTVGSCAGAAPSGLNAEKIIQQSHDKAVMQLALC